MNYDLITRAVQAALAPEVPEHLFDEEYDAIAGMAIEDFLEEVNMDRLTSVVIATAIRTQLDDYGRPVSWFLENLRLKNIEEGILNEIYAQIAALATRRAGARVPELGYWN